MNPPDTYRVITEDRPFHVNAPWLDRLAGGISATLGSEIMVQHQAWLRENAQNDALVFDQRTYVVRCLEYSSNMLSSHQSCSSPVIQKLLSKRVCSHVSFV